MIDQEKLLPDRATQTPMDYDRLMSANLTRVFGERESKRRIEAIRELYAQDAVLHEPHSSVQGHEAISEAVTVLLASLPKDFVFHATGPAVGHNGVGRLKWRAGPPDGPAVVTGLDVALFDGGLIRYLYVFIDPAGA